MKRVAILSLSAVFVMLLALPAWAYLPPAPFVIKTLAAKHLPMKSVRLRTLVSSMDGSAQFREWMSYDVRSRVLRSAAIDSQDRVLYSVQRKLGSVEEGEGLKASQLLFETQQGMMVKAIEKSSLPLEAQRLGRSGAQVAWVIGAAEGTQLWIEKDSFLPLRYVAPPQDSSLELRFEGYRFNREFPYPRTVALVRGQGEGMKRLLSAETQEILVNPESADPQAPRFSEESGWTAEGQAAPGSIRELIQSYYRWIR